MMRIEWRDIWINTLVDAGFSPHTARDTYQAMYGKDGPDLGKNAAQDAKAMLGKLSTADDFSSSNLKSADLPSCGEHQY